MAKFVQIGDNLDYKNLSADAIAYGDVVVLDKRIAIANSNIPVGATGTVSLTGVFEIQADTVEFAMGETLYWALDTKKLTKDSTGGIVAGMCAGVKIASSGVALVRL